MKDLAGRELNVRDLIVLIGGYSQKLQFGIIRKFTNNVHYYSFDSFGISLAEKDMKLRDDYVGTASYIFNTDRCVKIPSDILDERNLKYYNKIMQILNKNVATASNT